MKHIRTFLVGAILLVTALLVGHAAAAAQNLLTNGDAETGTLAGWAATGPVAAVTQQEETAGIVFPVQGSFFLSFATTRSAFANLVQTDTTGLIPGNNLTLSGQFQTEGFGDTGEAIVRVFDESDTLLTAASTGPQQTTALVWEAFSVSLVVPDGAARWEVELQGVLNFGTRVNAFFDAIELISTPPPPTPEELLQRIEALEDELADHTHTYLTGIGEGHNNTEAETGPAEDGE